MGFSVYFSSVNAILEKKNTHFFHVEILKLRDPRVLKRLKFFWIRWVFKLSTPMSRVKPLSLHAFWSPIISPLLTPSSSTCCPSEPPALLSVLLLMLYPCSLLLLPLHIHPPPCIFSRTPSAGVITHVAPRSLGFSRRSAACLFISLSAHH